MSGRSRRNNPELYSLDYGPLHRTGARVHKPGSILEPEPGSILDSEMDSKLKEKQIMDDLTESFLLFSLEELSSSDDIQDGIASIGQIGRDYRHIHIQLKDELGEDAYTEQYAGFDDTVKKVRQYQKDAKAKLKTLPETPDSDPLATARIRLDEDREKERKDADERVRNAILIEESVFREKLVLEIEDMDNDDKVSLEKYCIRFEQLLDGYYALLSRAKIAFSTEYETRCKDIFDKTVSDIRGKIKLGKSRIAELVSSQKKQLAKEQAEKEKSSAETLKREQMSVALILSQEIEARSTNVVEKCNWVKLSDFDDFRIWECWKLIPGLDIELREILTKFTEFSKISSVHCDENDSLVVETCRAKNEALTRRNSFMQ